MLTHGSRKTVFLIAKIRGVINCRNMKIFGIPERMKEQEEYVKLLEEENMRLRKELIDAHNKNISYLNQMLLFANNSMYATQFTIPDSNVAPPKYHV